MAFKNIKGIVVEIGGDTSGLQKALKNANSSISSLSSELKKVNSLLKLDPKNTELLTQKQNILKNSIKETSTYLQQLKKTADDFKNAGGDLNSDKFRAIQREIIETENKLKSLKLEASNWTKASKALEGYSSKLKTLGDTISNIGKKVSVASTAVAGLFSVGIKYNADIETTTKAFETFLGSTEKATKAINNIKKQAKTSPFDTKELIRANQYLITTGKSAENAHKTISALADAISLTGGGNDELNRMASNLQQISNAGKATSMDIRQFAYAGIDVYGILAETTGKNVEQLKEMDITYEDLSKALIEAASEGGKYYNGQAKMTDTLNGKLNMLKKTLEDLLGELTETLMPIIDKIITKIEKVVDWFKSLDSAQKNVITKIGLIVVALGPLLVLVGNLIKFGGIIVGVLSNLATKMGQVIIGAGGMSKVLTALTGPVGIVIAVVSALVAAFVHLFKTNEEFRVKVQETWNSIVSFFQTYVMPIVEKIKEFILNVLSTIWDVLQELWATIEPFVKEIFESLMDWWNDSGEEIMAVVLTVLGALLDALNWLWKNVFNPIIKFLIDTLKPVIGLILGVITGTLNLILDTIKSVWNGAKGIFEGIITFIQGVFSGDWKKAWEGVKKIFSNIVESLYGIFKAPLNFIISAINGFIKGINHIKIPDWVPGIGGAGINIPLIPKLAKGGIVDSATLAMVGEGNAAEAIIPLDRTLTKYMTEALQKAGVNRNIVLNFYPQQMTEAELDKAFNYIDRRFGVLY